MKKKQPFAQRMEAFFAGKGFYIVLALCVGVIGLSAWSMLTVKPPQAEDPAVAVGSTDQTVIAAATTPRPQPTAAPAPDPTAAPQPADTPPADAVSPTPAPTAAPTAAPAAAANDYFIWPVAGTVENGYSMDVLCYNRTMRDWRTHDGLDIAADLGAQVKAAAAGTVREVRTDDLYGTTVVIAHAGGLTTGYANLAATPTVKAGDSVTVGQVIGAVGDSALCEVGEVSHLHFSMARDGESVDPAAYLP